MASDLPGLGQLEATPQIFRLLLEDITDEEAMWKPAADRFSIAELLEHLSHVEGHFYRSAADAILSGEGQIEPYDQNEYFRAGTYTSRDPEDSFDHWEEQRDENIEFLRGLRVEPAEVSAPHPELGKVTLSQLLNEWAIHDLGHIRQVAELVRAIRYYPGLGPMQQQYTVQP